MTLISLRASRLGLVLMLCFASLLLLSSSTHGAHGGRRMMSTGTIICGQWSCQVWPRPRPPTTIPPSYGPPRPPSYGGPPRTP
ncbi:hypothetical protein BDA96_07G093400 [Sorghum bicolor]|uniref:Uncharacterized protein n=1 Tax=Sorghum bicolor TaxID=4558 RepID=A0A921QJX7_SORBI|nr:hypothetical protein BDA96_07G093400 [Sorghum bicolor]